MADEGNHVELQSQDDVQDESGNAGPLKDITNNNEIIPANITTKQVKQDVDQAPAIATYISTGLLEYLKNKTEGKAILNHYLKSQEKNLPLNKKIRNRLCRLVIAREKDHILKDVNVDEQLEKFIISKKRFEVLANEIGNIFKYECAATYFKDYVQTIHNSKKITVLATGKLWNHYNY
ncbi:uncharacterized protein LOC131675371 [Phymastichus coffea]|uniref:uncharacterized protein LOC131675371 n=1 Tax=Phymastichus coffea TaxID=108790 RepID=UPI00273C1CC7|nr:uncharacterized protein LOC131675371 [Phymastichus coffea]